MSLYSEVSLLGGIWGFIIACTVCYFVGYYLAKRRPWNLICKKCGKTSGNHYSKFFSINNDSYCTNDGLKNKEGEKFEEATIQTKNEQEEGQ